MLMCYKCTGGFWARIMHLCCLLSCIGIPAFVCVCLCKPIRMHAKAFFPFTASCFSHLYIYFLRGFFAAGCQRIFSHSGCQTPASHASLSPADYGEIKTCSLASQKFIMSVTVQEVFVTEDVISGSIHECEPNVHTTSLACAH